jgi:hypothetical protein
MPRLQTRAVSSSGNPHGNRHHTRYLLNQEFIQALLLHFREHGKKAIEKVAREQPASYLKGPGAASPARAQSRAQQSDQGADGRAA